VSFGHDVKAGVAGQTKPNSKSGIPDGAPGKFPSPFVTTDSDARPKTKLTQVFEKARKGKKTQTSDADAEEDLWEEVDELDHDADVTVDLNEPHSRSGKYWKSYFESYHADAKAEMEKLVKYKQLAKSYAKMKDSEALDLHQKLEEEQIKVKRMESRLADFTRQVTSGARVNGGTYDAKIVDELAKQTALAAEYREQVQELESLISEAYQDGSEGKSRRRKQNASPQTQKTLMEVQRELRRARAQVKEMGDLRHEISRLKSDLTSSQQKAAKLTDELSKTNSRILHLESELSESKAQVRQRDRELKRLRSDHDQLKENAKTRFIEAEEVLNKKNDKIADLKDEIRSLKVEGASKRPSRAKEPESSIRSDRESFRARDRASAQRFSQVADEEPPKPKAELNVGRQTSLSRGLALAQVSNDGVLQYDRIGSHSGDGRRLKAIEHDLLAPTRFRTDRGRDEMGHNSSSSALSDRTNLQQVRRAVSGSSVRHSYPSKDDLAVGSKSLGASVPTIMHETVAATENRVGGPRPFTERRTVSEDRPWSADSEIPHIDLVQGNFAPLGRVVPEVNSSGIWSMATAKTSLPADRRAAAIARLERKKADRARSYSTSERNKENVFL
jgi:hypothetical protein